MLKNEKIVLANLKANFAPNAALRWLDALLTELPEAPSGLRVLLALPDMALAEAAGKIRGRKGIALAAQTVSPYPQGNYTGSTPAAWLRGLVTHTLAGHRERRGRFRETVQDAANVAREALAEEITPIICVDGDNFASQLGALTREEQEPVLWAFTPRVEMPLAGSDFETIKESLTRIRRQGNDRPVLYGGGVNANNAGTIWRLADCGGLLVASACREPERFAELVLGLKG